MRKSRTIKLVLLGGGMLAASVCVCGGCFGGPDESPARPAADEADRDPQWYDEHGKPIPEQWSRDENGKLVPVGPPYDRHGRLMRFDENGNRIFAAAAGAAAGAAAAHHGYRRRGSWFPFIWGGRSGGSYTGGSRPSAVPPPGSPSTSRPSTGGGTVGRGGFGGGGSAAT